MLGTRIRVTYVDTAKAVDEVEITHYALGRLARWGRANGMQGLSVDADNSLPESVLVIQVCTWAEVTRGQARPADFDEWVAGVADFDPVEAVEPDPTQPAT